MIGVVLLATAFLITVAVIPAASSFQGKAEQQQMATALANQVMEESRARPFQALVPLPSTLAVATCVINGTEFQYRFLYDLAVTEAAVDLKSCRLTVTWIDGGAQHSQVLDTQVFGGAGDGAQR